MAFREKFKNFISRFLKILFPQVTCVVCGDELKEEHEFCICPKCDEKLIRNNQKQCCICGRRITSLGDVCDTCRGRDKFFDKAYSAFVYKNEMRGIIHKLKYSNARYYVDFLTSNMAVKYFDIAKCDVIVAVPLTKSRKWERGYNQSELLAKSLSQKVKGEFDNKIIFKTKNTKPQAKLSRKEREENLFGCFEICEREKVKGKSILIVDDVLTTGSTVNECARVLKNAGASKVYVLTACSTEDLVSYPEK